MTRRNSEDNVYRLEQEIRELKSENRQLHKRLKKVTKGYRKFLDDEPLEKIEEPKKEPEKVCWDCGKGILELKIVLNRRWRECNICQKRTKVKILDEQKI